MHLFGLTCPISCAAQIDGGGPMSPSCVEFFSLKKKHGEPDWRISQAFFHVRKNAEEPYIGYHYWLWVVLSKYVFLIFTPNIRGKDQFRRIFFQMGLVGEKPPTSWVWDAITYLGSGKPT